MAVSYGCQCLSDECHDGPMCWTPMCAADLPDHEGPAEMVLVTATVTGHQAEVPLCQAHR